MAKIPTYDEFVKMDESERRKLLDNMTDEEQKKMDIQHYEELDVKRKTLQDELFQIEKEMILLAWAHRMSS